MSIQSPYEFRQSAAFDTFIDDIIKNLYDGRTEARAGVVAGYASAVWYCIKQWKRIAKADSGRLGKFALEMERIQILIPKPDSRFSFYRAFAAYCLGVYRSQPDCNTDFLLYDVCATLQPYTRERATKFLKTLATSGYGRGGYQDLLYSYLLNDSRSSEGHLDAIKHHILVEKEFGDVPEEPSSCTIQ